MVALPGVFWGNPPWSNVKGQQLLCNVAQELLYLFPDVAKKCDPWPPVDEHDGVDGDFPQIHFHRCFWSQHVGAYIVRFEAKASTTLVLHANCKCQRMFLEVTFSMQPFLQTVHIGVSNDASGYVQILFTRYAHWGMGHKILSSILQWMTVSCFWSFFCISNEIATLSKDSKLLDCLGMRCQSLEKRMFCRHKSFVHFCSCLGTFEYLKDLQAKEASPMVSCVIDLSVLSSDVSLIHQGLKKGKAFFVSSKRLHFWMPRTVAIKGF